MAETGTLTIIDNNETYRARDTREPGHFWADNEVIALIPQIGAIGFALYMLLCYHARNHTGRSWPAIGTLADELGVSKPTIRTYLDLLKVAGLILVTKRCKNENGKQLWESSVFTLLDIKHKDAGGVVKPFDYPGKTVLPPSQTILPGVVKPFDPNNTNMNNDSVNKTGNANTLSQPSGDGAMAHSLDEVLQPTSQSSVVEETPISKPKRVRKSNPEKLPAFANDVKDAFAVLCYGTTDAWKMEANARMMMKHLKQIPEAERTLDKLRAFYCNWKTKDFRGQRGERPMPHEVIARWTVYAISKNDDDVLQSTYEVVPLDDSYVAPGPAR